MFFNSSAYCAIEKADAHHFFRSLLKNRLAFFPSSITFISLYALKKLTLLPPFLWKHISVSGIRTLNRRIKNMSDIFISYKREDLELAKALAAELTELGWTVWWDHDIPAGRD